MGVVNSCFATRLWSARSLSVAHPGSTFSGKRCCGYLCMDGILLKIIRLVITSLEYKYKLATSVCYSCLVALEFECVRECAHQVCDCR